MLTVSLFNLPARLFLTHYKTACLFNPQYFVNADDTVPKKVVVQKDSPREVLFRRAGPRQRVYFEPEYVKACIVTCGGLFPGLNTVIGELVCGLSHSSDLRRLLLQRCWENLSPCVCT